MTTMFLWWRFEGLNGCSSFFIDAVAARAVMAAMVFWRLSGSHYELISHHAMGTRVTIQPHLSTTLKQNAWVLGYYVNKTHTKAVKSSLYHVSCPDANITYWTDGQTRKAGWQTVCVYFHHCLSSGDRCNNEQSTSCDRGMEYTLPGGVWWSTHWLVGIARGSQRGRLPPIFDYIDEAVQE